MSRLFLSKRQYEQMKKKFPQDVERLEKMVAEGDLVITES